MRKTALPLSRVYRLLEPGPVVLVSTAMKRHPDVMPMSWHTMMDFEPPLVGCVIDEHSCTFANLRASGECVINVPGAGLARQVVQCGNASGRRVDKFRAYGLTAAPAECVKAPLVDECFASLECRLRDARWVRRYNLFVLEVVKAWITRARRMPRTIHHLGGGRFMVSGRTMKLPFRGK